MIINGESDHQHKQRRQKEVKPLQVSPAGEVLNPGATAGGTPLDDDGKPMRQSLVFQRAPTIALHDLPRPDDRPLLLDLPDRGIFRDYNYQAEHACTFSVQGEALAVMNSHQTVKLARFLVQNIKASGVVILTAYTLGLQELVNDLQYACNRSVPRL
jgi:hypothetical protein